MVRGVALPLSNGRLTEAENQKVADWMQAHWSGNKRCPVSLDNDWSIEAVVLHVTSQIPNKLGGEVTYLSVIPIVCRGCGYTMFMNARAMGVTPQTEGQ